jgi:MFS family permease
MTPPIAHDRRLVAWLSVNQLISWGSVFYLFALIMAPVERDLGLTRAQSSLAFSLALLAEGLLALPIGHLIDRGHERLVMTLGSLLLAVCLVMHSLVASVAGLYAVWIGLGVGMAATLYTPVFAVVTRRFPGDFRRAIITMTFLGGLASTVFIPLNAWLIGAFGWRGAVCWLAALHLGVCAPLHFVWLKHAPKPGRALPRDKTGVANVMGASAVTPARVAGTLGTYLTSAPYLLLALFVVLMMGVTAALPAHMVNLLRENGLGEAWAIAIPASIGVIQVLGRLLLYLFESRFDLHRANLLIPCLLPLALATLLAAPWLGAGAAALAMMALFVLLWGLGNGMLTIVKGTAMAQYVSRDHVAALNGALGLPLALARAAAPLALGLLWTAQSGYRQGLWLMLLMAVAGTLALAWAQRLALTAPR